MSDIEVRLKRSAQERKQIVEKFGFMPHSVLKISRGALNRSMFQLQGERKNINASAVARMNRIIPATEQGKRSRKERLARGIIGGIKDIHREGGRIAATTMPAELVAFFIQYYASSGQTYLDPFMAQGVQMQVAHRFGLNYWGYDVCQEYVAYCDEVREKIDDGTVTLRSFCADSRFPDEIPDGIGDFCFTSPPYWDVEYYGDEEEQLGLHKTYDEFLEGMEQVARAWLPKFKPDAWCVVNVNDLRRQKQFYPYHADTIALFERAGWHTQDMWIIHGLVGGLPKAFAVDFNKKRIAPKIHEYAIVFQPGARQ